LNTQLFVTFYRKVHHSLDLANFFQQYRVIAVPNHPF